MVGLIILIPFTRLQQVENIFFPSMNVIPIVVVYIHPNSMSNHMASILRKVH